MSDKPAKVTRYKWRYWNGADWVSDNRWLTPERAADLFGKYMTYEVDIHDTKSQSMDKDT